MQPPSRHPSSLSWKWLPVREGFPCRRYSFFGGLGLLSCLLLLLLSSLFSFPVVVPLFSLAPCLFVVCLVALPLLLFPCLPPCPLPRLLFPSLSGLPAYRRYHVTAAAAWLTALLAPSQFLWVGARPCRELQACLSTWPYCWLCFLLALAEVSLPPSQLWVGARPAP